MRKDGEDLCGQQDLSSVAGTYRPNIAIIALTKDASMFADEGEPSPVKFAVFLHEYLHYLHNFSTVAGIYGFFAAIRLLKIFAATVGASGISHGSAALDRATSAEFNSTVKWAEHLRGDVLIASNGSRVQNRTPLQYLGHSIEPGTIILSAQTLEVSAARIYFAYRGAGNDDRCNMLLGSHVLMESLAAEAEATFYERCGLPNTAGGEVPHFPYRVARTVYEGITGEVPSAAHLARYILFALQSSEPGEAFVATVNERKSKILKFGMDSETPIETLMKCVQVAGPLMSAVMCRVLAESIPSELQQLVDRGIAGSGITQMGRWCKEYLRQRLDEPFFELDAIDAKQPVAALQSLFALAPPCTIFSSAEMGIDMIPTGPDDQSAIALGCAQSMLDFVYRHLASGRIVPSSHAMRRPCPFLDVCQAPLVRSGSDICRSRPWESLDLGQPASCWYAHGVATLRTRFDLS